MIKPVNKNASAEVYNVLEYFEKLKGNGILVGQHTLTREQEELDHLRRVTGKLPALCGFELLSYSPNIVEENCDEVAWAEINANKRTLERAYEWAEKGGLITLTWHWYSPIGGRDKSFYAQNTDFDASKVLIEDTPERKAFYRDMDAMAEILKGFQEKHIPILWRPFHEAEGDWFWWGVKGMEVARQLYRLMFRYYIEEKHLDNLIWVWNNPKAEGYVGDEYCDILSRDCYPPEHVHTALKKECEELHRFAPEKPVALAEIGTIPDIEQIAAEKVQWLWFMVWSGDFAVSERFTTIDFFKKQYNHEYAITLEKLPQLY